LVSQYIHALEEKYYKELLALELIVADSDATTHADLQYE